MIGIDTNVLLRLLLHDDPVQERVAQALTEDRGPQAILLSDIVLVELAWTLKRKLKWTRPEVVDVFDRLLSQATFVFPDRSIVMSAVRSFELGRADFADYFIGALNHAAGVISTFTFDGDAADHRWFTLAGNE